MKIIDTIKERNRRHAIKFDEQYDWFSDETLVDMRDYQSDQQDDFEMVNWEANKEKLPIIEVDEADETAGGYLVDDFAGIEEIPIEQELVEQEPLVQKRDDFMEEIGEVDEIDEVDESVAEATEIDERVPDFASTQDAVNAAIKENRVMEIFYVTKGRGSRDEARYLKRERGLSKEEGGGVNIHRIVEPHYIYQAGNGNTIVVTYDRSVRRIRAFIIDNIYDYNFTKNRKTKEDQYFRPRMRVMPSSGKGIETMKNVNDKLTKIASTLESKGLKKSSLVVRDAIKVAANYKMAQYVGVQGYWLKNRRCWDNCYRHKRTAKPGTPAQEVWMECWSEYNNSINNDSSSWGKYANKEDVIKVSGKKEKEWNKMFVESVDKRVKEGMTRPVAIYDVIDSETQKYATKIIEASSDLMTLADTFSKSGQKEIGEQMEEIAIEMLKEAQFTGGWWDKTKDFFRSKGGKIAERLNRLVQRINQIMVNIQGNVASADASPAVVKKSQIDSQGPQSTLRPGSQPTAPPQQTTAPQQIQQKKAPPQGMPSNLSPAQVDLYGRFLSDLRKEMGYLFKTQTKNPDLMNITQPVIQSMGQFLTTSDELFKQTGKKTFNREQVMVALSNLLNAVTGATSSIAVSEQGTPAASVAPEGQTGGLPFAGSTASPTASMGPSQPTVTAGQIAASILQSQGGVEFSQHVAGDRITKAEMEWMLKAFDSNNLPFNSANWNEFVTRLISPI